MTTPNLDLIVPMFTYTFVGGATSSTNCALTSGATRRTGNVSINLPVGENTIRITALANTTAKVRMVATYKGKADYLNDWKEPGQLGIVLQAPNDDPSSWLALRSDTPGVLYGVTIINTPPAQ